MDRPLTKSKINMLVENQWFVDALTLGIRSFLEDGSDQSPIALLEFTVGRSVSTAVIRIVSAAL